MTLFSPKDFTLVPLSCPAGIKKFHIEWSNVRFCVPPEAQSLSVAVSSKTAVGLSIQGRMWSPEIRV